MLTFVPGRAAAAALPEIRVLLSRLNLGERADLGRDALEAMRYVCSAPPKQMLRFELGDDGLLKMGDAAERYLLRHAERGFSVMALTPFA